MVEKKPEFTGPLVNSWPGRLLTLEIARFSVTSWDPKKCRNRYFCSIISFAYTRPLKLDPPFGGSKKFVFDRAVSKKRPPPGPLINSFFWSHKKSGENSVFRFSGFRFLALFFCFWFCSPPKNYPQNFSTPPGWPKTGENKCFFVCFVAVCFGDGVFSMWCPYACVSLHVPCSLQMTDSAFLSYCSFCFLFSFGFFLGGGLFVFLH